MPAGHLELWRTCTGYRWRWRDKPSHLASVTGVAEADDLRCAWTFFDLDDALQHLLQRSAAVFCTDLALISA